MVPFCPSSLHSGRNSPGHPLVSIFRLHGSAFSVNIDRSMRSFQLAMVHVTAQLVSMFTEREFVWDGGRSHVLWATPTNAEGR
jgi:hypothetical protein